MYYAITTEYEYELFTSSYSTLGEYSNSTPSMLYITTIVL